ncbi:MAG TPA: nitroreductase family deazaflavin-dependent oxidoreductase [Acidimicrobiia bacterium]|nr:nitroreductase family deazaflavin-dependent oxidoreductase [Acidimicrobiia bacterium]
MSDWNDRIIEEFRANDGHVGGNFAGRPLLLLHHRGARSATERVTPLMYQRVGDGYAIFASKGGADTNPDWYHNLRAHPDVSVEVGTDEFAVRARIVDGEERAEIWERQKADYPFFADYEEKTARARIPVIVLEPN